MREIKFRAWYYQTNEMLNWNEIKECIRNIDWDDFMADCNIMQYTGLKDQNGKEIYEGDIIIDNSSLPTIIEWRAEESSFNIVKRWVDKFNIRIIGNIHENP